MKVIKKINNNAAICIDNHHHECVAFGKGIGFPTVPYELQDLSLIQRTFYGVSDTYYDLLNDIPVEIIEVSAKIVEVASSILKYDLDANIVFTLADHIHFAIQRFQQKMMMTTPFAFDIQHLYEEEMKIGEFSLKMIQHHLNVSLPNEEAIGIALHFINSEHRIMGIDSAEKKIITELTQLIEQDYQIQIDQSGFNYSRFVSHIEYLLKRKNSQKSISKDSQKLLETMKRDLKQAYDCAVHCQDYLNQQLNTKLNDEEVLYLILHINRLCNREI